jgi:eukaryotic-like serine/threonine-protein kinase
MGETRPAAGLPIRFGVFELDPDSGELHKAGVPIRLAPQPARVLTLLATHSGEVITREQIREQLWGEETHVDFDHGLNNCIAQIRTALSDDADTPRYIQTLPRRGYRFIAAVTPGDDEGGAGAEPRAQPRDPSRARRFMIGLAAGLAIGLLAVGIYAIRVEPGEPPLRRFTLTPADRLQITSNNTNTVIAPDGQKIVYRGEEALWIHDLYQDRARRIGGAPIINEPFWSPDSQQVAFHRRSQLVTVSIHGGNPIPICPLEGERWSGSWSPDGEVIVFLMGARPRLYKVAAKSGQPRLLFDPVSERIGEDQPAGGVYAVRFLPAGRDSRIILFAAGSINEPAIYVQDLKTGRRASLGPGARPWYSHSGHIVYQESSLRYSLWAVPFSIDRFATTGKPFQVAAHGRDPSVALDGTLVYIEAEFPDWRLTWRDRQGRSVPAHGEPLAVMQAPELSPDQRLVAIAGGRASMSNDLWIHDLKRGTRTRLTRAEEELKSIHGPAWSPDGTMIAYAVVEEGIFVRRSDGIGGSQILFRTRHFIPDLDWSRDGRHIVFAVRTPGTGYDLFYLAQPEPGSQWQSHPFLVSPANTERPRISPNGRYAAYQSNVTGRPEVYVRSFPDGDRNWAISSRSGRSPRWSRDGRELYYVDGTNALIAVPVRLGDSFEAGPEQKLFEAPDAGHVPSINYPYDVAADGQRFLLAEPVGRVAPPRIRVVQSWHAEFRNRR